MTDAELQELRTMVEDGIAKRREIMATWPALLDDQPADMGFWSWLRWTLTKAGR